MMTPKTSRLRRISSGELDGVLEQMRDEGQTTLALVGPDFAPTRLRAYETVLALGPLGEDRHLDMSSIAALKQLTSLAVAHLPIDPKSVRTLASLGSLTSLILYDCKIGDKEVVHLVDLTNLQS